MNAELDGLLTQPPSRLFAERGAVAARILGEKGGLPIGKTVCLTLLAGAGTRWVKSLREAKARLAAVPSGSLGALGEFGKEAISDFPLEAPRGLFPVEDHITDLSGRIAMAAYAIDAFRGLGRQVVVVRGWEREIEDEVLRPLRIPSSDVDFLTQAPGPLGKVLGHGDAVLQAMDLWRDADYVLVNFGGDASSPLTALLALLFLAGEGNAGADLLLPVAKLEGAAYPIFVDAEGIPRAFGHDKLAGENGGGRRRLGLVASGFTNVGLRAYRAEALADVLLDFRRTNWRRDTGWEIPGNDPEGHELALDNVDALMASRGKARLLPVAAPEELAPAKSFDELPRFEAAVRQVRKDWGDFVSGLGPQEPPYRRAKEGVDRP